eukprot:GHRQ01019300.1.p3 GENE.GHRQ01019300.1~~GHRQ01019300.1.p3  ORF type:complete len:133 (+),score=16.13 GHRQ01019300.1:742-1140(+)
MWAEAGGSSTACCAAVTCGAQENMQPAALPLHLFTVRTGTSSGIPAKKLAMRASFARWLLGPSTLPTTMSPMSMGLILLCSSTALNTVASRSTASVSLRPPRLACRRCNRENHVHKYQCGAQPLPNGGNLLM